MIRWTLKGVASRRRIVAGIAAAVAAGAFVPPSLAQALPDGRHYELVSEPTHGMDDVTRVMPAADDGNTVAYATRAATPESFGVPLVSLTVARRTASAWTHQSADTADPGLPVSNANHTSIPLAFSSDFSHTLLESNIPFQAEDQDGLGDDFWDVLVGSGTSTLVTAPDAGVPDDPAFAPAGGGLGVATSVDMSHIAFWGTNGSLLLGGPSQGIYERSGGHVRLASVLPNGLVAQPPVWIATQAARSGNDGLGAADGGMTAPHRGGHAVSDSGDRIFWMNGTTRGPLYVREAGATTRLISASRRPADLGTARDATFIAASHSGSVVYFTTPSTHQLLTSAPASGVALYRYDLDTDTLQAITTGVTNAGFQRGIVSDDATHVYFTATAVLAPGATSGRANMYVWDGNAVRFIATLGNSDRISRVSRDGGYAVVLSTSSLGGAPNAGHAAVYLYDEDTASLSCASCRPDGSPSQGDATLDVMPADNIGGEVSKPRNVTDDGRVFFDTTDQILGADTNDVYDVYEYAHGVSSLISSGTSSWNSYLADNSDDGRDVFFMTHESLAAQDGDEGETDLYDARTGADLPAPARRADSTCSGDACQGAPSPAPTLATPTSTREGPDPGAIAVPPVRAVHLGPLSGLRNRLAKTGAGSLVLTVQGGGPVSAVMTTVLAGRTRTAARASRRIARTAAVTVRMPLRLSAVARRELHRTGRLRLHLVVRMPGGPTQTTSLTLRTARR